MTSRIVFATNNSNKIKEIKAILGTEIELLSLEDVQCKEELPETSPTIEANALQKAMYMLDNYNFACFADDSGLEVEALEGAPGVYSARYAGSQRNDSDNIAKLLEQLGSNNNRRARFKTVIAWVGADFKHTFEGVIYGNITLAPVGNNGFGYDPIFIPDGYTKTFAQMSSKEKNEISHRAVAVRKFSSFFSKAQISK